MTHDTRVRVGIWGVFGRGNYGNEATLRAMLERLDDRFEPIAVSHDPAGTRAEHGIAAVPTGAPATGGGLPATVVNRVRFAWHTWRLAAGFDVVCVAGEGGLEEEAPLGTPFEIWCFAVAARLRRRPFTLVDVGVAAPSRRLTRSLIRGVGALSAYRSYRDTESRAHMSGLGLTAAARDDVVTDMAMGLRPPRARDRDDRLIVFGVMEYGGDGRTGPDDPGALDDYIARCSTAIDLLTADGFRVVLVIGDLADAPTAARVSARCRAHVPVSTASDADELVLLMSGAAVVVASRYHSLIFALLAGTPPVSLGYNFKGGAMLDQLGFGDDAFDAGDFDARRVAARVGELAAAGDGARARVDAAVDRARSRLDEAWPPRLGGWATRTRGRVA